jgi:hypothetical protein
MQTIADKAGIAHMCTLLNDTYQERVSDWYCKYVTKDFPEDDNEQFVFQSGEEIDNSQFTSAIEDVPLTLVGREAGLLDFGEIDLVFNYVYKTHYYVIVEVKRTTNPNSRRKARKQIRKWLEALEILRPDASVVGCTYVEGKWDIVGMNSHEQTDLRVLLMGVDTPFTRCLALHLV